MVDDLFSPEYINERIIKRVCENRHIIYIYIYIYAHKHKTKR
jgi:hypothetical protein